MKLVCAARSSDDINKFLWMVRIGGGVYPDHIKESNYLNNVSEPPGWGPNRACDWMPCGESQSAGGVYGWLAARVGGLR